MEAIKNGRTATRRKRRVRPLIASAAIVLTLILVTWAALPLYRNSVNSHIQKAAVTGSRDWNELRQSIMDVRGFKSITLRYVEPWGDGALVFYTRAHGQDVTTQLSVEYMRRSISGWKWVNGGGFSSGEKERAVFAEYLPYDNSLRKAPFPLLYGTFDTRKVTHVIVLDGEGHISYAVPFPISDHEAGWFALVPDTAGEWAIVGNGKDMQAVESRRIRVPFQAVPETTTQPAE